MTPLRALLEETAARTGVRVHRLVGPERTDPVARARFAFAWAAQQGLATTKRQIAAELGRAEHSSGVYGVRRAEELRTACGDFRLLTDTLTSWIMERAHG